MVLGEMLTGRIHRVNREHIKDEPFLPRLEGKNEFLDLCSKLISKRVYERPSMHDVLADDSF